MADTYANFAALAQANTLGIDYDVFNQYGTTNYTIHIAIHGGAIEPPTGQLARYCAGATGACYVFSAKKPSGNQSLFLSATNFDDPFCVANVGGSVHTVSWHGVPDVVTGEQVTYISGLDTALVSAIAQSLQTAGFTATIPPVPGDAVDPRNICNRNIPGAGLELRLSQGMCEAMYVGGDLSPTSVSNTANRTPTFTAYANAVTAAISAVAPAPATPATTTPTVPTLAQPTGAPSISTAMRRPFAIDHGGGVAATTDARVQLLDRVHALVGTLPGERVMRATYGVPTHQALFASSLEMAEAQLRLDVADAVAQWEPSAAVSALVTRVNEDLGVVQVDVQVSRADVPGAETDNTRAVTVSVGGAVTSTPT